MYKASGGQLMIGAILLFGLTGAAITLARQRGLKPTEAPKETAGPPAVDAESAEHRLEAHVRMLSETFSPRDHEHTQNLDRTAAYVRGELEKAGVRTSEQVFQVEGRTYRNILATCGPNTPERIVIGAHYDAAGPYPAADDNASGIAGLIELASRLSTLSPTDLPLRLELVAFTLEEPPYFASDRMGSAIHAASLRQKGVAVRAMLSLEMIGYFTDAPDSQEYPDPSLKATYPSQGNFIAVVGRTEEKALVQRVEKVMQNHSPMPVRSLAAPASIPGIGLSDHRSYWDAGYPALMVTDTAFYRNPNYHTAKDRPETLDYRRMAMVVDGVYGAILMLSR